MNTNQNLPTVPEVGMVATYVIYTDRHAVDVIKVSSSKKTITVRQRKLIVTKKPVMVPGGFAAVVVEDAKFASEPDPDGEIMKFSLRKSGQWKKAGHPMNSPGMRLVLGVDSPYYDYGF